MMDQIENFVLVLACWFLVACFATLHPALSVRRSVGPSVRRSLRPSVGPSHTSIHYFFGFFCGLWPHCSHSNDSLTSITAPAHPYATGVAVYPTLFYNHVHQGYDSQAILHWLWSTRRGTHSPTVRRFLIFLFFFYRRRKTKGWVISILVNLT